MSLRHRIDQLEQAIRDTAPPCPACKDVPRIRVQHVYAESDWTPPRRCDACGREVETVITVRYLDTAQRVSLS